MTGADGRLALAKAGFGRPPYAVYVVGQLPRETEFGHGRSGQSSDDPARVIPKAFKLVRGYRAYQPSAILHAVPEFIREMLVRIKQCQKVTGSHEST